MLCWLSAQHRNVGARAGKLPSCHGEEWRHRDLKGEAMHGAHDGLIRIDGCADEVLLAYADDPSLRESKLSLKKDEMFGKFVEYFNAEQPSQPNVVCRECWRYRVTAEFTGRLDIAESSGWRKDAKTGKR